LNCAEAAKAAKNKTQTKLKNFANFKFRIKFTTSSGNLFELLWNNDNSIFEKYAAISRILLPKKTYTKPYA